jgi:hypothetical protein
MISKRRIMVGLMARSRERSCRHMGNAVALRFPCLEKFICSSASVASLHLDHSRDTE